MVESWVYRNSAYLFPLRIIKQSSRSSCNFDCIATLRACVPAYVAERRLNSEFCEQISFRLLTRPHMRMCPLKLSLFRMSKFDKMGRLPMLSTHQFHNLVTSNRKYSPSGTNKLCNTRHLYNILPKTTEVSPLSGVFIVLKRIKKAGKFVFRCFAVIVWTSDCYYSVSKGRMNFPWRFITWWSVYIFTINWTPM